MDNVRNIPSKIEALYRKTRNHRSLQSLMVLESKLSLPIPFWSGSQVYLRFLIHDVGREKNEVGQSPIYTPYARVSIRYDDGKLVEFVDLSFAEGEPSTRREIIGYYPHKEMKGLEFKAAMNKRTEFFQYTEDTIQIYGHIDLSPSQIQIARDYWIVFGQVSEPSLRSSYEKLSRGFFEWINDVVG